MQLYGPRQNNYKHFISGPPQESIAAHFQKTFRATAYYIAKLMKKGDAILASFFKAYKLKQRYARRLLKQKGIHGIGVGYLNPAKPGKGAAVIVYADQVSAAAAAKGKKGAKAVKHRFSPSLPGKLKAAIPVRLIRSSRFRKNASSSSAFQRRVRPVIAGYSVGTPNVSGTAGLIVSDKRRPGSRFILSNNHVLVNENTDRTSLTLQPGGADGGTTKNDTIGRVDRFVRLRKKGTNFMDAALSKPRRPSLLFPSYAVYRKVPGYVRSYRIGDRFKKVGRTSGAVNGIVESIHTDVQVDYGDYGGLGTITFKNQSVIRGKQPVSLDGDSGSVWLTRRGNLAAAVNFAGSDGGRLSIAYPVDWFMEVFGTRVAKPGQRSIVRPGRGSRQKYMCTRPLTRQTAAKLRPCRCRPGTASKS